MKDMDNAQLQHTVNMSQQEVEMLRKSQREEAEKSHKMAIEIERIKSHMKFLQQENERLQAQVLDCSKQLSATTSDTVAKTQYEEMKSKYDADIYGIKANHAIVLTQHKEEQQTQTHQRTTRS